MRTIRTWLIIFAVGGVVNLYFMLTTYWSILKNYCDRIHINLLFMLIWTLIFTILSIYDRRFAQNSHKKSGEINFTADLLQLTIVFLFFTLLFYVHLHRNNLVKACELNPNLHEIISNEELFVNNYDEYKAKLNIEETEEIEEIVEIINAKSYGTVLKEID